MVDSALRSRAGRLLLTAALLCALTLGVTFIVVHRLYDLRGLPTISPISDEQSRRQVVDPARQFIAAGDLRNADATYLLQSCSTNEEPPYQGTVYVRYDVPGVVETTALYRRMARTLTSQGWRVGLPPGRHPGGWTLAKGGVTAVYYRDPDLVGRGVLRVYGECRNLSDHRLDGTGFIDVTREVSG